MEDGDPREGRPRARRRAHRGDRPRVRNGLGTILGYAPGCSSVPSLPRPGRRRPALREEWRDPGDGRAPIHGLREAREAWQVGESDSRGCWRRVVARERRAREEVEARLVGLDAPLGRPRRRRAAGARLRDLVRNAVEAAAAGGRHVEVVRAGGAARSRSASRTTARPRPGHPARSFPSTRPGGGLAWASARPQDRAAPRRGRVELTGRRGRSLRSGVAPPGGPAF